MKLSFNEIVSCANGIARTEENELGLELHRFTRNQEGFFYTTHPYYCRMSFFNGYFGRNCRTGSGITLDFLSDAKTIDLQFNRVELTNDSQDQKFDLFVDNELVKSYDSTESVYYESDGKTHRFTVYFPYFAFPIISSLELIEANTFTPCKKEAKILFVGDSITHGVGASLPSDIYPNIVARNLDVGIINQANSGFIYDKGSIERAADPEIIVTAYGVNDYGHKDEKNLETETEEYLIKLRAVYPEAKIVSVLPVWTINDITENNSGKREVLKSVYSKYCSLIVDGLELIPRDEKNFSDIVHPNSEGYKHYGENLSKILKTLL